MSFLVRYLYIFNLEVVKNQTYMKPCLGNSLYLQNCFQIQERKKMPCILAFPKQISHHIIELAGQKKYTDCLLFKIIIYIQYFKKIYRQIFFFRLLLFKKEKIKRRK